MVSRDCEGSRNDLSVARSLKMTFITFIIRGSTRRTSGRIARPLAMAVALLAPLFSARTARANPHPLPFTYPWETLSQGEAEVEQYVDIVPLRTFEAPGASRKTVVDPRYELTTEIEYGITDRLELGLYFAAKNAPEELGANAPIGFDGIKQRLRYRIGKEGELPVELSVYFEVAEMHDEIELEEKLNLQKRFGHVKAMANLWIEESFVRGGAMQLQLHPTGGVAYQVTPNLWTGVEYWMTAAIPLTAHESAAPGSVDAFNARSHHFVGPTLAFVWDKLWWGLGGYARLDDFSRAMQPGDALGHVWVRSVVGMML